MFCSCCQVPNHASASSLSSGLESRPHRFKPYTEDARRDGAGPVCDMVVQEATDVRTGDGEFLPPFPPRPEHMGQSQATMEEQWDVLLDDVVRLGAQIVLVNVGSVVPSLQVCRMVGGEVARIQVSDRGGRNASRIGDAG